MDRIVHKKAHFEYEVLERYEAGIELFGHEVKAVRNGKATLEGSHVIVRGGEAFLVGATVQPYQPGNTPPEYDPVRPRRLLLTRKEISELIGVESRTGLTIIPLAMYNKHQRIKVEIAAVRGKKRHDKRETIKKRESNRTIERELKSGR